MFTRDTLMKRVQERASQTPAAPVTAPAQRQVDPEPEHPSLCRYVVEPCREETINGEKFVEVCSPDDKDIAFWGVYAVRPDGLSENVCDKPTKQEAEDEASKFRQDYLGLLSQSGDPTLLHKYSETLIDVSNAMALAVIQNRVQFEESADFTRLMIAYASEFERRYHGVDWDAIDTGYAGTVEAFAEEKIEALGGISQDAAATEIFRANLKHCGAPNGRAFEWRDGQPLCEGKPLFGAVGTPAIWAAVTATMKGQRMDETMQITDDVMKSWAMGFAEGAYHGASSPSYPWAHLHHRMSGAHRTQFEAKLAALNLPLPDRQPSKNAPAFRAVLKSYGNPDMQQYFDDGVLSPNVIVFGNSPEEIATKAREYIAKHELGGGNWGSAMIVDQRGQHVARVAYNGSLWDPVNQMVRYDPKKKEKAVEKPRSTGRKR